MFSHKLKPKDLIVEQFNIELIELRVEGLWDIISKDDSDENQKEESSKYNSKLNIIRDELGSLGLTVNEIEIYLFLARSGPKKASDISKMLEIPKTETYETLSTLQRKGILNEIAERPVKFEGLSLKEVFKLLIQKKKSDIENSEQSLNSVVNLWKSLPPTATSDSSPQQFQKILGIHRIYHKIREMTQKASNEITIMISKIDLAHLMTYGVMDEINSVIDNGVDVTIITEPECDILSEGDGLNIVSCSSVSGSLPQLMLMDRSEMIAVTDEDLQEKETRALWTNCSSLCDAIHLFFTYEFSH